MLLHYLAKHYCQQNKPLTNDKLQGSVAVYLTCGGVVNDQIKERFLAESESTKIKLVNNWQSYKQERDCLVQVSSYFSSVLARRAKVHETTTLLLVTVPNTHRFKKIHSHTQQ